MSQSTTANKPVIIEEQVGRLLRISPLAILILTLIFVLLSVFSDSIHQALDPSYRLRIQQEQQSQQELNDALDRVSKPTRPEK